MRERNDLPAAALLPHELESLVHYARLRDPADFENDVADRVRNEVDQLVEASEKAADTGVMFANDPTTAPDAGQGTAMADNPQRAAALAQRTALMRDPEFQARYHSPHIRIRKEAVDQLLAVNRIIAGEGNEGSASGAPVRDSVISPPVTIEALRAAAPARKAAPFEAAALRKNLEGLNPSQRAAKLSQMFGPDAAANGGPAAGINADTGGSTGPAAGAPEAA